MEGKDSGQFLDSIKQFINYPGFLPHQAEIESISSEGVIFKDGNGSLIQINQLSDGYRSILSLTFELIRQLARIYGDDIVFQFFLRFYQQSFLQCPGSHSANNNDKSPTTVFPPTLTTQHLP